MNRKNLPLVFLAAALPATMLLGACGGDDDDDDDPTTAPGTATVSTSTATTERTPTRPSSPTTGAIVLKNPTTTPSGLQYEDVVAGTGDSPRAGQQVTVHYTGTFVSGEKFDSSRDSGRPFTFIIGNGNVIKGWDEGVMTMKVGGKRNLLVPPALGYGARDYGPIPGGSTLLFEVELLSVQ